MITIASIFLFSDFAYRLVARVYPKDPGEEA
jgi:hypothetical protein